MIFPKGAKANNVITPATINTNGGFKKLLIILGIILSNTQSTYLSKITANKAGKKLDEYVPVTIGKNPNNLIPS